MNTTVIDFFKRFISLLIILLLFNKCKEEIVPEKFFPRSHHEAYEHSLKQANLLSSGLGIDWQNAARRALNNPTPISTPFQEVMYLDPNQANALGYRFSVKRGQKVMVNVKTNESDSSYLFMDLYRISSDSIQKKTHVATADKHEHIIAFEPRRNADYVLRIQPELLRGGRLDVKIMYVAAFKFPVTGKNSRAIHSVFGDPRDGGKREHHGVDIFAKRHTPIIAPTKGYIRYVGTRGIGGRVVWLYDTKRNQSLYFAHLEKYLVEKNQKVNPGDTLGTVGNTGNAKYTPPHLHFGIYNNGPIDPYNFIAETDTSFKNTSLDIRFLGQWARINKTTSLKPEAGVKLMNEDTLNKYQLVKIVGASLDSYRVDTPDAEGYISGQVIESIDEPISTFSDTIPYALLDSPTGSTIVKSYSNKDDSLSVLGIYKDYSFVETPTGHTGWIQRPFIGSKR